MQTKRKNGPFESNIVLRVCVRERERGRREGGGRKKPRHDTVYHAGDMRFGSTRHTNAAGFLQLAGESRGETQLLYHEGHVRPDARLVSTGGGWWWPLAGGPTTLTR